MNQQPDKLFRDKLAGYQKTAPTSAWNRLEEKLDKKNNKPLWLKVAAGLALLACASLIFLLNGERDSNTIASKQPPTAGKEASQQEKTIPKDSLSLPAKTNESAAEKSFTPSKPRKQKPAEASSVHETRQPSGERNSTEKEAPEEYEVTENIDDVIEPTISEQPVTVKYTEVLPQGKHQDENITLIYSADEVNEKYLNKKSLAEATREEKKPSTLKRLLDKAYDLKHNQDAFGELRQKKNEILALNFKNEKQRSQNR